MKQLFATTARGFEELLKTELTSLGAVECRLAQGGVHFAGDDETLYRTLLWSRLASRMLLPVVSAKIYGEADLYSVVLTQNWLTHFDEHATFLVDFNGTNREIRHTQFGAMRVKDGIVDYFERHGKARPNVDKHQPDIRIHAYLNRNELVLSLDLSGDALHRRGWREDTGAAPLRETLAAAMVLRSGWQPGTPLVDPMCGSGTLLIEAAQMEAQIAPQLSRRHWGFDFWKGHNQAAWENVKNAAEAQAQANFNRNPEPHFFGADLDHRVLKKAQQNARHAGVAHLIQWKQGDIAALRNPFPDRQGTVICNPPYGERLGTTPALVALYTVFGQRLKSEFARWQASVFSSEPALLSCLRLRSHRQFKAKNGPLDCVQKNYHLTELPQSAPQSGAQPEQSAVENSDGFSPRQATQATQPTEVAVDFANRLRKNLKKLEKWAAREGVDAYRLYDADLPEYNLAVDRYGDHIVVQEYAAPKNIDENKARQRLLDAVAATLNVTGVATNKLVLKVRQKQKGSSQYEKLGNKGDYFSVREYGAELWVNLTDYLDTGLFLDHRFTRKMLGEMAADKDFLNLFAYTGSATVHAALGGAKSTTTVDMSNTYLNWAEQNLLLNGIKGRQHKLIQADCLQWAAQCDRHFDLIFVDPPTFSNSKRMEESWDVQRDHIKLMADLKPLLRPHGTLVFSNNKRGFKMDIDGLQRLGLAATEISAQTLPPDFARNKQIHNCWLIRHQDAA